MHFETLTPAIIHGQLLAEAERVNLPKHYRNDVLVHDRDILASTSATWFVWILRTCGSFLITLEPGKPNYHASTFFDACSRFGDEEKLYYQYKDGKLSTVTVERARVLVIEHGQNCC